MGNCLLNKLRQIRMFKFAASLVAVANAGRIPLIKNELTAQDVEAQRLFYEYYAEEMVNGQLPVKDYMNTQYFVNISVGTPAQEFTKIATHKVIEETYWTLDLKGLKKGDTVIPADGFKGVIDSGTSLIAGPEAIVNPLIEGLDVPKDCSGLDALPDLTFTLDSTDYVLKPTDYVLEITQGKQTQCLLGIQAITGTPEGFNYLIMGDVFMRPYPTFFDKDANEVTFFTEKAEEYLQ